MTRGERGNAVQAAIGMIMAARVAVLGPTLAQVTADKHGALARLAARTYLEQKASTIAPSIERAGVFARGDSPDVVLTKVLGLGGDGVTDSADAVIRFVAFDL